MDHHVANLLPTTIVNQTVLMAALDWGMGHTTRLVPIIKQLLKSNNTVYFAGNQKQLNFIQFEFPEVKLLDLSGYSIQLDGTKSTYLQALQQFSKFNKGIKKEKQWLETVVSKYSFDLIISDNRYGLYHKSVKSIIVTHQLNLQVPYFKKMVNKRVQSLISNFNVCWVPDNESRRLTGELTNAKLTIPMHFIGPLCRFRAVEASVNYDSLVILSGPEPERTNFLDSMIKKMTESGGRVAFVGAKVKQFESFQNPSTAELELLIAQSNMVYSRAGYTTIMELDALNKKAVLYPTKGQYEQGYLAGYIKSPNFEFRKELN